MPAGASEDFLFCALEIDSLLLLLLLLYSDAAAEQGRTKAGQLRHLHSADVYGERRQTSAQIHRQQR